MKTRHSNITCLMSGRGWHTGRILEHVDMFRFFRTMCSWLHVYTLDPFVVDPFGGDRHQQKEHMNSIYTRALTNTRAH